MESGEAPRAQARVASLRPLRLPPVAFPDLDLTPGELFSRLASPAGSGLVVLTPNRRLAAALEAEFDARQQARSLESWEAPDILPFAAFLERLHDDALHADGALPPALLTPAQEAHLWEDAILGSERGGGLLAVASAAAQCRAAWQVKHAWRVGAGPGNEDTEAFAEWSRAYLRKAGDDLDHARLADAAAAWADPNRVRGLVAWAFDILTPQQRDFFDACAARGIPVYAGTPEPARARVARAAFADAATEIDAAARWARDRLEAGAARIGVVVPDLQQRRRQVMRAFHRVLCPGRHLPGAAGGAAPFNVSIGEPLAGYPLVRAALDLIALAAGEVDFALASRLVRSPFVGGAEPEASARALLDVRMRQILPARVTLARLVAACAPAPVLRERLVEVFRVAEAGPASRSPHDWARHWSALIAAAGHPGDRALDSAEYQTLQRWHRQLAEFACLARVAPRLAPAEARARLARLCAEALFQPESPDAPVQVLGVLESSGLRFDALWVSGLTDEAWPLTAQPSPFLPIALQKKAGVPEASADASLALDQHLTGQWLVAASEVVVSHAAHDGDRKLAPSPLITAVPLAPPVVGAFTPCRDVIFAARALEPVADGVAPAYAGAHAKGGARLLADQAACPFRAFARHRLGAHGLEVPAAGLDAAARGTLLHELMAGLWRELRSSDALRGDVELAVGRAAAAAVAALGLEGAFAKLERARLEQRARDWLALERQRAPFEVVDIEDKRVVEVGGLSLDVRIDRMDRLADGAHLLIDYKSGSVTRRDWLGERPLEPQLPLYAIGAVPEVSAVAFACLKRGELGYSGYGRDDGVVERAEDWQSLRAAWRAALEALARDFLRGVARVDPKQPPATCRHCDLQALCRVHEKRRVAGAEEEVA